MRTKLLEDWKAFSDEIRLEDDVSIENDEFYKSLLKFSGIPEKNFRLFIDYITKPYFRTVYTGVPVLERYGVKITLFFCNLIKDILEPLLKLAKENKFKYSINYLFYDDENGTFVYSFNLKRNVESINYKFNLDKRGLVCGDNSSKPPLLIDINNTYEYLRSLYDFIADKSSTKQFVNILIQNFSRLYIND